MTTRAREGGGGSQGKKAAVPKPSPASSERPIPNYLRPTISSTLSSRRSNSLDLSSSSLRRRDKPPSPAAHLRPRSSAGPTRTPPHASPMRSFSSFSRSNMAPAGPTIRRRVSSKVSPTNSSTSAKRVVRSVGARSVTSDSSVEFEPSESVLPHQGLVLDVQTKDDNSECVVVVVVDKQSQEATMAINETEVEELLVVTEEQSVVAESTTKIKEEHLVSLKEETKIGNSKTEIKAGEREMKDHLVVTEEERIITKIDSGIEEEHSVASRSIDNTNTEIKTVQPKEKEHFVVTEEERSVETNTTIKTECEEKEEHLVITQDQQRGVHEENEEIEIAQHEKKEDLIISKEEINIDNSNVEDCVNQRIGEEVREASIVDEKHVVQVKTTNPAIVKFAKQTQPRKKETSQAYNDVIEETASKLMENKRNKVRALAGAFETVISLQDNK